jgi:hypothetical protein
MSQLSTARDALSEARRLSLAALMAVGGAQDEESEALGALITVIFGRICEVDVLLGQVASCEISEAVA